MPHSSTRPGNLAFTVFRMEILLELEQIPVAKLADHKGFWNLSSQLDFNTKLAKRLPFDTLSHVISVSKNRVVQTLWIYLSHYLSHYFSNKCSTLLWPIRSWTASEVLHWGVGRLVILEMKIWSHPFFWFRTFWLFLYRMNASIFWALTVWTHVKRHVQPSIYWGPQLWTPCCGQQWNLNQTIVMEPWRGCDFFVGKGWDTVQDGINMCRWNWGQLMVLHLRNVGTPFVPRVAGAFQLRQHRGHLNGAPKNVCCSFRRFAS